MYRLILVPLDGTAFSEHALPLATTIATAAGSPLRLVRVAMPPALGTELYGAAVLDAAGIDEMRRESERYLRVLAGEVAAARSLDVTPVVLAGGLPNALVEYTRESGADLVVMTTHDRGRLERLVLGSVAESVVRAGTVPVLLVRPTEGAPAVDRPPALSHVLIPLDGSALAHEVIPHAVRIAMLLRMEMTLLAVVDPTLALASRGAGEESAAHVSRRDVDGGTDLGTDFLDRTAEPLRAQGLAVYTRVLTDRQPAHAIVTYAKERAVDLIAMTTHGRGAVGRLFAGSVAEEVLHASPTPVLMYRPPPQ